MSTASFAPSRFFPPAVKFFRHQLTQTKPAARLAPAEDVAGIPLICFCHLPWHGVWQRPQQLLSRLADQHPVLFVETYCSEVSTSGFKFRQPDGYPRVTVLEMHLPAAHWSDGAFVDFERRRLLQDFCSLKEGRYDRPILWFNDPMAVTAFAGQCEERAIVYDCMDELAQFKGAPSELRERERQLLQVADVVFCGGRKMREKRLPLNPNCHFYGTGVDCGHFGAARTASLAIAPEIAALRGPVLGYFGVIDERIDYELLVELADTNPEWSVAMVGPTAKISPAELPRRRNLHWIGPKPYGQLPAITKGFSVCLMPFALNAATEFINPTKALEYMASGRPVVSTALDEVKTNFGAECVVTESHAEFVAACAAQIASPDEIRIAAGIDLAARQSWESIVEAMDRHIYAALLERSRRMAMINTRFQPLTGHV